MYSYILRVTYQRTNGQANQETNWSAFLFYIRRCFYGETASIRDQENFTFSLLQ